MTRLELKRYWMFFEAFKNDKVVQCKSDSVDEWIDMPYIESIVLFPIESLRVKPEPTKRLPTIEEVERWFLDNKVFKIEGQNCYQRIISFDKDHDKQIIIGKQRFISIEELCEDFIHLDGSELYITENE